MIDSMSISLTEKIDLISFGQTFVFIGFLISIINLESTANYVSTKTVKINFSIKINSNNVHIETIESEKSFLADSSFTLHYRHRCNSHNVVPTNDRSQQIFPIGCVRQLAGHYHLNFTETVFLDFRTHSNAK